MSPVLRILLPCLVLALGCGAPLADSVERDLRRGGTVAEALERIERQPVEARPEAYRRVALAVLEAVAVAGDPRSRDRAFVALSAIGSNAEPLLARLSASADEDLASRARAELGRRGDRAARRLLERDLDSTDDAILARAIGVVGSEAPTDRLFGWLDSTSSDVRREAAEALVGRGLGDRAETLFEVARRDPSAAVRAAACRAVARDGEAAERIAAFLEDEPEAVTYGACLAAVAAHRPPSFLVERLATLPTELDERSFEVVRIGEGSPAEAVRSRLLERLPSWLATERPSIRAALVNTLPEDLVRAPILDLRGRLRSERVVVVRVALAARLLRSEAGREEAIATLEELRSLETPDGVAAASLLRTAGREGATELLEQRSRAADPVVRSAALRALGGAPDPTARASSLLDPDERVRLAAAVSLLC